MVLATGGYESNPDLVRDFEGLPNWLSLYPASITGDGLLLATEIGAAVRTIRNNLQLFLAFPLPPDTSKEAPQTHLASIIELCSPHTIVVNQAGKRFADESYFQGMVPALRHFDPATHCYPNLPCYLIFDQTMPPPIPSPVAAQEPKFQDGRAGRRSTHAWRQTRN